MEICKPTSTGWELRAKITLFNPILRNHNRVRFKRFTLHTDVAYFAACCVENIYVCVCMCYRWQRFCSEQHGGDRPHCLSGAASADAGGRDSAAQVCAGRRGQETQHIWGAASHAQQEGTNQRYHTHSLTHSLTHTHFTCTHCALIINATLPFTTLTSHKAETWKTSWPNFRLWMLFGHTLNSVFLFLNVLHCRLI